VKSNELLDFQIVHALEQRKERMKSLKRYLLASTLAAAIAALLCTAPADKPSIDLPIGGVTLSIPLTLAINLSAITSAFIYLHFALASRLTTAMEIRLLGLLFTRYGTKDLQQWLIFDSGWSVSLRFLRNHPVDTIIEFIAALPVGFGVPALYVVVAILRPQLAILITVAACAFVWWAGRRHFSDYLSFEGLKRVERESSKRASDAIAISLLCDKHLAAVPSNASQAKVEGDGNKPGV
jgi:hypothetical protein